ncbi:D-3-phosphoglycerate dehydrogenase [Pseudovibrio ascidiaceicola]|uniref:D-3-phosphoglycerate dehydrogenase n=1 Tax=Pseudovibrio ascidiaceicola TaxID=285279 RepID=A0A1I3VGS1_9HYPH|nr:phosphoglycerate dehydrogenase [Pseudovibrio ascidiaceicola]SFJ94475.1 D-3-phosphoglycerate dehydrogenase [Pseudovibrio ascidiaceicola]
MKRVLVSNIMMLKERERFDKQLRDSGYQPVWPKVKQFLTENDCLKLVGDVDGWLAGDDQITRTVLEAASPRLKVISKWGTGVDSIDRNAAEDLEIPVFNSPGAFSHAVAEVALHYMLSLSRHLVQVDRDIRRGHWPKPLGIELSQSKVGIVGFGAIGQRIGDLSGSFGASVYFFDPQKNDEVALTSTVALPKSLEEIANECDFICLACNYTSENHHLINAKFLNEMKSNAYLINVARGQLVDERALEKAIASGQIAGAGLDVFDTEPLPVDSILRNFDNVILGSHNANNALAAVENVHQNTLRNLDSVLSRKQVKEEVLTL